MKVYWAIKAQEIKVLIFSNKPLHHIEQKTRQTLKKTKSMKNSVLIVWIIRQINRDWENYKTFPATNCENVESILKIALTYILRVVNGGHLDVSCLPCEK